MTTRRRPAVGVRLDPALIDRASEIAKQVAGASRSSILAKAVRLGLEAVAKKHGLPTVGQD